MGNTTTLQRERTRRREKVIAETTQLSLYERAAKVWEIDRDSRNQAWINQKAKAINELGLGDYNTEYRGYPTWYKPELFGAGRFVFLATAKNDLAFFLYEECGNPKCDHAQGLTSFLGFADLGESIERGDLNTEWECPKCKPKQAAAQALTQSITEKKGV